MFYLQLHKSTVKKALPANSCLVPAPETAFRLVASATIFALLTALDATDLRENILDVALVKVFLKLLCL